MIRLYGNVSGSFRTVTEGIRRSLEANKLLAGYYEGETDSFDEAVSGADAPVSITTGPPLNILTAHVKGIHKIHTLMLAPNSEGIPPQLREDLAADTYSEAQLKRVPIVDVFLAPSLWAKGVLEREFPKHTVMYCPHGVLSEFSVDHERRRLAEKCFSEEFRVLHFTSSRLSRKGTRELVEAWNAFLALREYQKGRLDILCNPAFLQEFVDLRSEHVAVHPAQNFTYQQLVKGMSAYHLIAQPSRAEGFGLVPIEARACGIPTLFTKCTGHLDHIRSSAPDGCVIIPTGPLGDSDDYWGAKAPTIEVVSIFDGLCEAYSNWKDLNAVAFATAKSIQEDWAWEKVTASTLKKLAIEGGNDVRE